MKLALTLLAAPIVWVLPHLNQLPTGGQDQLMSINPRNCYHRRTGCSGWNALK